MTVGSHPHVQVNNSEVQTAWALYPDGDEQASVQEEEEWEVVGADENDHSHAAAPQVRWLGGSSVSVACVPDSIDVAPAAAVQLPMLVINDHAAVQSMCIAAALSRCRHPSCSKHEATSLALRYGFLCSSADTVMVAVSSHPTGPAATAAFAVAVPSSVYNGFACERDYYDLSACTSHNALSRFSKAPLHEQSATSLSSSLTGAEQQEWSAASRGLCSPCYMSSCPVYYPATRQAQPVQFGTFGYASVASLLPPDGFDSATQQHCTQRTFQSPNS